MYLDIIGLTLFGNLFVLEQQLVKVLSEVEECQTEDSEVPVDLEILVVL